MYKTKSRKKHCSYPLKVYQPNGSVSDFSIKSVSYINGNVEYLTECLASKGLGTRLTECHAVVLGLSMIITPPVIFVFTAFLLLFPLMERYFSQLKCWVTWHMRLKPWYDAYGGPYKDEYRFWTGLLLIVRCTLVLAVTFITDQLVTLNILMWTCLILIPLVALLQVYNSTVLNVLEIVYLCCLLAMVFLSNAKYNEQLYIVTWISLCFFIAILVFQTWEKIKMLPKNYLKSTKKLDEQRNLRNVPVSSVRIAPFDEDHEPLLAEIDIS